MKTPGSMGSGMGRSVVASGTPRGYVLRWRGRTMNDLELPITGMTCASCANRVEKSLNGLEGVTATVNYATEKATVAFPDAVAPDELVAAVRAAGYDAALPAEAPEGGP